MTQKLFAAVAEKCCIEGADSVMMQEVLLGGHLYLQVLKERLQTWLQSVKLNILKKANTTVGFSLKQGKLFHDL